MQKENVHTYKHVYWIKIRKLFNSKSISLEASFAFVYESNSQVSIGPISVNA